MSRSSYVGIVAKSVVGRRAAPHSTTGTWLQRQTNHMRRAAPVPTRLASTAPWTTPKRGVNRIVGVRQFGTRLEALREALDADSRSLRSFDSGGRSEARSLEELLPAVRSAHPLVDSFGREHDYLRISLTERCNLRCRYCMPAEGVTLTESSSLLSSDEIVRLAKAFVEAGVKKIRLTGGEPLVRQDAIDICKQLAAIPGVQSLGITTNGLLLSRRLPRLLDAGVSALNISLDTLDEEKFTSLTRRQGFQRVLQSIDDAVVAGFPSVKVNVVVMRDVNHDEVCDFIELTRERPIDVRFIEFMPFGDNAWSDSRFYSYADMLHDVVERFSSAEVTRLVDGPSDTSKGYQLKGAAGRFGFITSMSEHFCRGCNRLRLTADGHIKVCLFGNEEVSLRDALRAGATDEQIMDIVGAAVGKKHAKLGGNADMYGIASAENRPMILIGG